MKCKFHQGFSLLEVLLAMVIIIIAGMGIYSLFGTGKKNVDLVNASDEAVQIANVYTDLASSSLTAANDNIPALLQNSGRLSNAYFSSNGSGDVKINNAFGSIEFSNVTPYSFKVVFPLSCSSGGTSSSSSIPGQFFSKVNNMYNCNNSGSKKYSDCSVVDCAGGNPAKISLYFNMNQS